MQNILPPQFKKGDIIGVFSPSCPSTAWIPERTHLAFQFIKEQGYNLKPGALMNSTR